METSIAKYVMEGGSESERKAYVRKGGTEKGDAPSYIIIDGNNTAVIALGSLLAHFLSGSLG